MRIALLALALHLPAIAQTCAPPADLKTETDATRIQHLAVALLPCLAHPDPRLRDDIAFEQLSAWSRAAKLQAATLQRLRADLVAVLDAPPDAAGVHQPFAVLTLAEVARADRLQPFMTAEQRAELVARAARYLVGMRDYRGLVAGEGWRHGVAHGADLALQLGMNAALTPAQRQALLDAVTSQVLANHRHAYRFGEGQRLARAALQLQLWLKPDATAWQAWLDGLLAPLKQATAWDETAMTDLHNLRGFLWPLLAGVLDVPDTAQRDAWQAPLQKTLRRLP
ncbi:DUF2785 domain-containing protein [Roseateles asaccharophilus]|uniref:DUF2785 domain-containing protein n=1 Tax=Roseateles asaccharophilus TaxID=582607 RepID=A0ABU2A2Z9_9BURK|nr:DUF2785 domain-containing protein [Roseateles asaccharophilus]MDR7331568.1 hypothetical protein [Roseateles asaccharophilus]